MKNFSDDICQFANREDHHFDLTEYNALCQRYLANKHINQSIIQTKIAELQTPFSYPPQEGMPSILLIHGLSESPFSMRDMANKFIEQGYGIQSVLLPGHGSNPQDLHHTNKEQWIRATQYAFNQLKQKNEKVIIAGVSLGAALALNCAIDFSDVAALILIAPALQIATRKPTYMKLHNILLALKLIHSENKYDYAKYPYSTTKTLKAALSLMRRVRLKIKNKKFTIPIFGAVTLEDEVISAPTILDFFSNLTCCPHKLLCYTQQEMYSKNANINYIYSRDLGNRIINFSHTCLHISPENELYGTKGKYIDYRNIFITKKMQAKHVYFGSVHRKNLKFGRLARLRFNPKFDSMMSECMSFLREHIHSSTK
jgi:esterase/lipase